MDRRSAITRKERVLGSQRAQCEACPASGDGWVLGSFLAKVKEKEPWPKPVLSDKRTVLR